MPVIDPALPAWRQPGVSVPMSDAGLRLPLVGRVGYDVILWVVVLLASMGAALAVFHYFPPA